MELDFKQGMYNINPEPNFNFQLNRVIMWDSGDLKDVMETAQKITDNTSWKREMIGLSDNAVAQNRIFQAIAYYLMGEFFMIDGAPTKTSTIKKLQNPPLEIKQKANILLFHHFGPTWPEVTERNLLCRKSIKMKTSLLPPLPSRTTYHYPQNR